MSGWWIQPNLGKPNQGLVCVDDCPVYGADCSSIPANVYIVRMWESKDGVKGEILYNHSDRAPVREKFTDVSPYIPIINQWMLLAQSAPPAPSPPLTVAQAKAVKIDMVNYLFNMKRQASIVSVVKENGIERSQTWDASDENVSNMQSTAIGELSGTSGSGQSSLGQAVKTLELSMNTSIANFNVSLNNHDAQVATFNADVNNANNSIGLFNSGLSSYAGAVNANWSSLNYTYPTAINDTLQASTVSTSTSLSGDVPPVATSVSDFLPAGMPSQSLADANFTAGMPGVPTFGGSLGQMNSVSAGAVPDATSPSPTQNALAAIKARRDTLKGTQTSKTNDISALTSVAAVAAYDITTGW